MTYPIDMYGLCDYAPLTRRSKYNGFINERFVKDSITRITFTVGFVYEKKPACHIWCLADGLTYRTIVVAFCAVRRKRRAHLDRGYLPDVFIFVYEMIMSFERVILPM